jgi:hypothetical protein
LKADPFTGDERHGRYGQQGQDEYANAHDFLGRERLSSTVLIGTAEARCKAAATVWPACSFGLR